MKKTWMQLIALAALLVCAMSLTACGNTAAAVEQGVPADAVYETPPESPSTDEGPTTLEDLLGEDYQSYLTETITMQMGNRMEKNPEIRYYPIDEQAPLSDYVTIDESLSFEVDEEGNPVILFPAGTVTDMSHGEQSFRIPKLR